MAESAYIRTWGLERARGASVRRLRDSFLRKKRHRPSLNLQKNDQLSLRANHKKGLKFFVLLHVQKK